MFVTGPTVWGFAETRTSGGYRGRNGWDGREWKVVAEVLLAQVEEPREDELQYVPLVHDHTPLQDVDPWSCLGGTPAESVLPPSPSGTICGRIRVRRRGPLGTSDVRVAGGPGRTLVGVWFPDGPRETRDTRTSLSPTPRVVGLHPPHPTSDVTSLRGSPGRGGGLLPSPPVPSPVVYGRTRSRATGGFSLRTTP